MSIGGRTLRRAALLSVVAFASVQANAQDASSLSVSSLWSKWGPFIDLEGKVGTKRNLGEADLFVPLWENERSMLFGDARFKADDQDSHEGNFGLGFRRTVCQAAISPLIY